MATTSSSWDWPTGVQQARTLLRALLATLEKESPTDAEKLEIARALEDQCMDLHNHGDWLIKTLPEAYQHEAHARTLDSLVGHCRRGEKEQAAKGDHEGAALAGRMWKEYEAKAKALRKKAAVLLRKPGKVIREEADGLAAVIVMSKWTRKQRKPVGVPDEEPEGPQPTG